MKILKSFSLSVLTAASTLIFVAVSTPAQACGGCTIRVNGPVLNGPVLQGPVLQGPVLQGPVLQGISLQGISLQGISLQGISLQGVSLQGVSLQGPVATGAHVGKFIAVTLPSGETIKVR